MAESRDLRLRKDAAAALVFEYLLRHPLSSAENGLNNDQKSAQVPLSTAVEEPLGRQQLNRPTVSKATEALRRLTDQQVQP